MAFSSDGAVVLIGCTDEFKDVHADVKSKHVWPCFAKTLHEADVFCLYRL